MHPKHFTVLILIIVAMIFIWENKTAFRGPANIKEPRILVATRDLSEGELLKPADFKLLPPADLNLAPGERALSDQELFLVQGRRLKSKVSRGNALLFDSVFKTEEESFFRSIPKGLRAYFIETEHLEFVKSGAKVDLVLKPTSSSKNTLILVDDVLILSVDKTSEAPGVVVALTPDEIDWVERNLRFGRVVLAFRNPNEARGRGALKKGEHPDKKRVKVELITEGP